MYPHERSLVQHLAGKPFALVGVNSDPNKDDLKAAMAKEQISWRSFWDRTTKGSIATKFKIHGWPTLYVIDHKGAMRYKFVGSPGDAVLDQVIVKLVKEAEGKK
jgi:hypothetical protein